MSIIADKPTRRFFAAVKFDVGHRYGKITRYTKESVVPCCKACNSAKSTMGRGEFLSLVRRIYKHRLELGASPEVSFL